MAASSRRRVLVLGAGGFIGGFIVARLQHAGWSVRRVVRSGPLHGSVDSVACDLAGLLAPSDWEPLLEGVDVVVNAAGILRESGRDTFATIHLQAPLALAQACVRRGVRRFVQVSAIGQVQDGEFIASKHAADETLLRMEGLSVAVLRPSVVYSTKGSYGGTSLLRSQAAFPVVLPLPGDGRWCIQPVDAEDLALVVERAAASEAIGVFEVGAPEPMTLRDYQLAWRRWLGVPGRRVLAVPEWLVGVAVAVSERLGRGPLARSTWRMLRSGNVTAADAWQRLHATFGSAPRPLDAVLAATPSQVQDRWHARLALLEPALRWGVALLFLLSAWAGWQAPEHAIEALTQGSALQQAWPVTAARAGAVADLLLGVLLLVRWRPRLVLAAMLALVLGYTLVLGAAVPALWLAPLGGLAKNLVVLPALALLWVMADRR